MFDITEQLTTQEGYDALAVLFENHEVDHIEYVPGEFLVFLEDGRVICIQADNMKVFVN